MRRAPAHPIYYAPEPKSGGALGTICTVLLTLAALVMAGAFVWRATGGVLPMGMKQAPAPIGGVSAPQAPASSVDSNIAAFNATQQAIAPNVEAPAQSQARVEPNVSDQSTWPTAVIAIPTVIPAAQVTIVPKNVPLVVAPGSIVTPIPTIPYPTPLPAAVANDYKLSEDGKCISAPRAGKTYQVCQDWKYGPNEVASVADYIRTGLLPGVEVK